MHVRIELDRFGDWQKAYASMHKLSKKVDVLKRISHVVRRFAEKYKRTLILGITSNGAHIGQNWAPVSDRYGDFKERFYRTSRSNLLYASGNYLTQIQNTRVTQQQYKVSFKFSRGALNTKSRKRGLRLAIYSMMLEHGHAGRNILPRPLWGPSFRKIGGFKKLAKDSDKALRKHLQLR